MGTIPLRDDEHGTAVTTDIGVFYMESLRNFIWNPKQTFCARREVGPKSWKSQVGDSPRAPYATRQSAYV